MWSSCHGRSISLITRSKRGEFGTGEGGFSRDASKPISYAARRELNYYMAYAKELMLKEPSGLASRSLQLIEKSKNRLNSLIHAGPVARKTRLTRPPFDPVDKRSLEEFESLQSQTFVNCCIVLCAYRRAAFDRFPAASRAYFDGLVGQSTAKAIRKGPFGLL